MNDVGSYNKSLRILVTVATAVGSTVLWRLFISGVWNPVFDSSSSVNNFGVPLTHKRTFEVGVFHFFPRALYFDWFIAGLAIISSAYCVYRLSATWTEMRRITYIVACISYFLSMFFMPSHIMNPFPWIFVALTAIIPIAWLACIVYSLWDLGEPLFGTRRRLLLPLFVLLISLGFGWWSYPRDVFYDRNRNDVEALVKHLSDDDPRTRSLAISALRGLGPYDDSTAEAILRAMSDPEQHVRSNAVSLASDLGKYSDRAVPILLQEFVERGGCLFELQKLGPIARQAVATLKEKLPGADGYQKLNLCQALWKIDGNTKLVVPASIELLQDDFRPIRISAAQLLGEIGPGARAAIPFLKKLIDQPPKQEIIVPIHGDLSAPVITQMSEAEFYPRILTAAHVALIRIQSRRDP